MHCPSHRSHLADYPCELSLGELPKKALVYGLPNRLAKVADLVLGHCEEHPHCIDHHAQKLDALSWHCLDLGWLDHQAEVLEKIEHHLCHLPCLLW